MVNIFQNSEIDREEWGRLVRESRTGTWFQTPEAYEFFASQPELFQPFVIGVYSHLLLSLRGVCVGYVTVEKNPLKQFFTRRAIIIGGPALADDATDEEVEALMKAVKDQASLRLSPEGKSVTAQNPSSKGCLRSSLCSLLLGRDGVGSPIYIETRNFNDYSRWRNAFEQAGFIYQPHLNFHVHTNQPWETIEKNIGKHRKKYIRLSYRDGVAVELDPTLEQVREYYCILEELYRTKVKMPLQPRSFFEKLYQCKDCKYLLVLYKGLVIGGSICMLLPKHGIYEWYACGKDGIFKNIHPSSVTKFIGMKYAAENGYPIFDMMGAGKPEDPYGVRDFKAEFGGELVEHGRYLYIAKPMLYHIGTIGVKILKKLK